MEVFFFFHVQLQSKEKQLKNKYMYTCNFLCIPPKKGKE